MITLILYRDNWYLIDAKFDYVAVISCYY